MLFDQSPLPGPRKTLVLAVVGILLLLSQTGICRTPTLLVAFSDVESRDRASSPEELFSPAANYVGINVSRTNNNVLAVGSQWLLQWDKEYGGWGHSQQSQPIGDIDEDGVNEVLVGGYETTGVERIISFDARLGTYIEEYNWTYYDGSLNSPSGSTVLDLDGDRNLEFAVSWSYAGTNDGVWAYDFDGRNLATLDHYYASFVFDVYSCDYDDDGIVEILVANAPRGGTPFHVIALGWQNGHFVEEAKWKLSGYDWEAPMLWSGDTDNDGKTEVIVCISDGNSNTAGTWALNWDTALARWEPQLVYGDLIFGGTHYGVAVGDVDGDGVPEIGIGNNAPGHNGAAAVLIEWNGSEYVKVWEGSWLLEYSVIEAVAVGDADNDGKNEFVAGGGYLHIIGWTGASYVEKATITDTVGLLAGTIIGDCDSDGMNEIKACDINEYGPGKEWIFDFKRIDSTPPSTSDNYDGLWHTADFPIILTASDDLSGVAETYYVVNGMLNRTVGANGRPYINVESGNNTLEYWSVDRSGNEERPHKPLLNIKLDKTCPTGSLIINDNRSFTNSSAVTLKLSCYDSVSGVKSMRFSSDGSWENASWEPIAGSRQWNLASVEGSKTVYAQVADFAGLVSQTFSASITLDQSAPYTSCNYDGNWTNSDFHLNLNWSDNFGGQVTTYYITNKGPLMSIAVDGSPLITREDANNTLEYWSEDEAGNAESHRFRDEIRLDKTAPIAVIKLPKDAEADTQTTLSATDSSDNCSGIDTYFWQFGDEANSTEPIATHVYSKTGSYNVTLTVVDKAGNSAQSKTTISVQAKTPLYLRIWPWLAIPGLGGVLAISIALIKRQQKKARAGEIERNKLKPPPFITPLPPSKTRKVEEVKPLPRGELTLEEVDYTVLDYITDHKGTVSMSRMADDLGLTLDELNESITKLKEKHLID
jgi:hypothetical protein